jgi:NAD(P)-dependent dehydrogenase (short-subunit alcohol dehydrogenase family)
MTTRGRALEGHTALITDAGQGLGKATATRSARRGRDARAGARGRVHLRAVHDEATELTPPARLISPEDVAATAVFLASDASCSTSGADVNVSGGLAMH